MVEFPEFSGVQCAMMRIIQGQPMTIPRKYAAYRPLVSQLVLQRGEEGWLTIDEAIVEEGSTHRGYGAGERFIHTEACQGYSWGPSEPTWGVGNRVKVDPETQVSIANSLDDTCRVWPSITAELTAEGHVPAEACPDEAGELMKAGEVRVIGVRTPHECVPQKKAGPRQFVRLVGIGIRGRADHFTKNPLMGEH